MNKKPDVALQLVIQDVVEEINRARDNVADDAFDKTNSMNDWIAYINAYTGRAAHRVFRNAREGQTFRDNMVKAAGLALSAIRAHDKGYMEGK